MAFTKVSQPYRELVTLHLSWILRFIIEAPYRQIKYDTMQVDKHIPNNNETGAHEQADEISTKTVGIFWDIFSSNTR